MKNMKKLVFLTAVSALCAGQVQAQNDSCYYTDACAPAYCESEDSCCWSAAIPLGALAVAAILIATTDHGHHHSSSHRSGSSSSHSHSHSHAHYSSSN